MFSFTLTSYLFLEVYQNFAPARICKFSFVCGSSQSIQRFWPEFTRA